MHSSNGFPEKPGLHLHWGMWLVTMQSAFRPQIPGLHGLTHFRLMHAWSRPHSELLTHSGRQPRMGSPWYPGRQVQMQLLPTTLWFVFGPQGFGLHGLLGCSGSEITLSVGGINVLSWWLQPFYCSSREWLIIHWKRTHILERIVTVLQVYSSRSTFRPAWLIYWGCLLWKAIKEKLANVLIDFTQW